MLRNRIGASFVLMTNTFSRFEDEFQESGYSQRCPNLANDYHARALALITMTGCFASPRANDTFAGAAIGAGGGALVGGAEGSPGTGALIGGLGGGAVGYLVGTATQHRGYYGPYGPYGGY